ncbi:hypothetical protein [Sphingobacterium chuzhouense]|nr:hypothetical protein [Sphingobacterium chuzhouense]
MSKNFPPVTLRPVQGSDARAGTPVRGYADTGVTKHPYPVTL